MTDPDPPLTGDARARPVNRVLSLRSGPALAIATLVVVLGGLEIAARVWVAVRWSDEALAAVLEPTTQRAGFVGDTPLGYRLQPDFSRVNANGHVFTHSSLGHREPSAGGGEGSTPVTRVVLAGGSTVYGMMVTDTMTASVQLRVRLQHAYAQQSFEVLNLGVPGWTSRETVLRLEAELPALQPDIVIVIDGRNELFPQAFDGFREDYGHYRELGWRLQDANRSWKRLFTYSRFLMLLLHDPAGGRTLGYSFADEDPVYGNIRYENAPANVGALRANLEDPARDSTWRRNVERLVRGAHGIDAHVVLVEMPFRLEGFVSGVLPLEAFEENRRAEAGEALQRRIDANNRILAEVAAAEGATYLPIDRLIDPAYLVDDCHFNEAGESALADLLAKHVVTAGLVARRQER